MCQNAKQTAINLLTAIEPTIVALGKQLGLSADPIFTTVITEYNNALTALQSWVPGNVATEVEQALSVLQTAVSSLPIPASIQTLVNIILAGLTAVVGVISANSPAPLPVNPPTPTPAAASAEETQGQFAAHVAADTAARVEALVPGFKRSIFHSPQHQYKTVWNDEVKHLGLPEEMLAE